MRSLLLLLVLLASCSGGKESFPGYRELLVREPEIEGRQTVHVWELEGPAAEDGSPLPFEIRAGSELVVRGDGHRTDTVRILARAEPGAMGAAQIVVRALLDAGAERTEAARTFPHLTGADLMGLVSEPAAKIELRPGTAVPLVRVAHETWTLIVP